MHTIPHPIKEVITNIENFLNILSVTERAEISQKGNKARQIFNEFFPHLTESVEHLAKSTGISSDLLYAFNNPVSISNPAFDGCSNYLSVGKSSRNRLTLLHKTRDTYRTHHGNWNLEMTKGKYKFIRSAAVGDYSVSMGINEKGLAVTNNGVQSKETHGWSLHHRLISRKILEEAGSLEEALVILDSLPRGTGFNMLLCDASERGMVVEGTAYHLWHEIITDGFCVTTNHHFRALAEYQDQKKTSGLMKYSSGPRYESASKYLGSRNGDITLEDMNQLSRCHEGNPGAFPFGGTICSHGAVWSTTTAGTFIISPRHPDTLSMVWASTGFPCSIPYVPLYICQDQVPVHMSDGGYFHLAEKSYMFLSAQERCVAISDIENSLMKNAAAAEKEATKSIEKGKQVEAVKHLSEFSNSAFAKVFQTLDGKIKGNISSLGIPPPQLHLNLPDEVPIIPTPQDRPIRYTLANLTNEVMHVSATIEGIEERFWISHPRNLFVQPGQTATGSLILSREWEGQDKVTTIECVIWGVVSKKILARQKTKLLL